MKSGTGEARFNHRFVTGRLESRGHRDALFLFGFVDLLALWP
jgi:hypothetical protein